MRRIVGVVCLMTLASCMSFSDRAMRPVRDSIEGQLPDIRLEKEFAISMGSGLFNMIDVMTLNEADLSEMDHVDVAVYNVYTHGREVDFNNLNFEATLLAKNQRLHWETIVKVRKESEQVWVLAGMDLDRETLEAVAVFSLQQDELVLINVDGDLNRMLEFAMRPAGERRGDRNREQRHRERRS